MLAEAGNLSRVAIALDLSWGEVYEIAAFGHVAPHTAAFWNCCRREARHG
jgi:hypothetical protein